MSLALRFQQVIKRNVFQSPLSLAYYRPHFPESHFSFPFYTAHAHFNFLRMYHDKIGYVGVGVFLFAF